jgi:hypothetical protein
MREVFGNLVKSYFLAALFLTTLIGCASFALPLHETDIVNREILHEKKIIYIDGIYDTYGVKENIRKGLERLDYTITENRSDAELIVRYSYKCYYDVIHYTCPQFYFSIFDKELGEILLTSSFGGDSPFSVKTLLERMFQRIKEKL